MSGRRATDSSDFVRIIGDIRLDILNAFQANLAPDFIEVNDSGSFRPAKWLVVRSRTDVEEWSLESSDIIYRAHTKSDAIRFLTEQESDLQITYGEE